MMLNKIFEGILLVIAVAFLIAGLVSLPRFDSKLLPLSVIFFAFISLISSVLKLGNFQRSTVNSIVHIATGLAFVFMGTALLMLPDLSMLVKVVVVCGVVFSLACILKRERKT